MKQSPIKWAGGKGYLVSRILEDLEKSSAEYLVEVFCGSAVLSINSPVKTIAADVNTALINFMKHYQQGLSLDPDLLEFSYTEAEYYEIREEFRKSTHQDRRSALLFYYLNKMGFNGLYRENAKGVFNVPWGKRTKLPPLQAIPKHSLSHIEFKNCNYKDLEVPPNSFIYLDPPYDASFSKYNGKGFTWDDQVELLDWAKSLGCPFVISNLATERIVELYEHHKLECSYINAPRKISSNGDRTPVVEIYALYR